MAQKLSSKYNRGDTLKYNIVTANGKMLLPEGIVLTNYFYNQLLMWEAEGIELYERENSKDYEHQFQALKQKATENLLFTEAVLGLKALMSDIMQQKHQPDQADRLARALVNAVRQHPERALRLPRSCRDEDLVYYHSVSVCLISMLIGLDLEYDNESLCALALGALLHDLGKLYIRPEILLKRGELSQAEREEIKEHPILGYEALRKFEIPETVLQCALQHHEKCDGAGYPFALKYAQLELDARIVAVADVYTALTASRPHRQEYDYLDAIEIIHADFRFGLDRQLLDTLYCVVLKQLANATVELSNGYTGYIVQIDERDVYHPMVLVLEKGGAKVASPFIFDLKEHRGVAIDRIMPGKKAGSLSR
ncbi:HD domain-containing protein [Heliobacterium undosum]|uniref:HD domain-containing protein n=1 Tax=Heliomicrobium undosum TaxID=121734 RepID=A0A845L026_9FIRM|nr:HD domain-containing phosphohydrolase [Heliomicrobium undosum]MZP28205.1 HD domain-containing protein [Heliomicrobium undosum]